MLLSFKIDEGYLERIEELQGMGFLPPTRFQVMNDKTRLVYNGTHRDFRGHVNGVKMLFNNGFGSLYPIATYIADDNRFRWYEDLDLYLMERGTWEEFFAEWRNMKSAETICEIPQRFLSQRNMFEKTVRWLAAPPGVDEPWVVEVTDYLSENPQYHSLVSDMLRNFKERERKIHQKRRADAVANK